jgi:aldehyde dehydrogenase (NAD+)
VALIFGSWNYPYVVGIGPLIAAIGAGNCAVIKPSEMGPAASAAIQKLVDKYLDNDCFRVIQGGVDVAIQITSKHWDVICFTGSTDKGKLVAAAAAKNLVPCILELGGKCPCIIDESADVDFAARKVAFGRFYNSGQTCLATDYVLCHEKL